MTTNYVKNWILLTGLSRESGHWGGFVNQLQSAFPGSQIFPIDLPGTGRFYRHSSPKSINGLMTETRKFAMDQGYLEQPASILALSLGAMVAWEWLLNHPDDLANAVLIGASFGGLSPFYQRMYWKRYKDIAAFGLLKNIYDRELAILQLISNRSDHAQQITEKWKNIQTQRPVSNNTILRQLLAAANYKPGDSKPYQPVLLLNSKGDRLVSPLCSEAIHKKWNLDLVTHPWAGHDLPLDDGLWVVSQIKNWLDQK